MARQDDWAESPDGQLTRRMVLAGTAAAAAGAGGAEATAASHTGSGAVIDVKAFGAVGDGVSDDTRAIQAAMNEAGRGRTTAGFNVAEVVFPPGVYRLTDAILLPFGSGRQSGYRALRISGHGVVLKGSGSRDDAHDCFVSARWTGAGDANEPTLRMADESSITYGVVLEGFTITGVRRALDLKNWNHGCAIRDVFCLNVQQALRMQRCFYCQVVNVKSRGAPEQDTKANFDISSQANIAPLFGLNSNGHAVAYRISGTHGLALYDCSFESAEIGLLLDGEVPQMSIVNGYFEGCSKAGIRIDHVVRSLNLIGCFVNQAKARFIVGPPNRNHFAYVNFVGNRFHSGDLTLDSNVYGTFSGPGVKGPDSDMPLRGNHKVVNLSPRMSVETASDGWTGPARLADVSAGNGPNPGMYRGGFGDRVAGNDRAPWQRVRSTDRGGGTVWTVDTDIDFAENLFGSWLLEFTTGGRKAHFHYMLMGAHNGREVEIDLYAGNPLTADRTWFRASNHQGKLRLTSAVLQRPQLIKSVLRIF